MWAPSINYGCYRAWKTFDQSFSRHLVRGVPRPEPANRNAGLDNTGATAAGKRVLDSLPAPDAGQDQNRAVIAPPQAKHRQWPSFGR